jgi:hypothetical protein
MTRDIRQANRVTSFATNQVTLEDYDGTNLVYRFDPLAGTLTRTKGTQSRILLRELEVCTFTMMQRNLIEGTQDNYPTDEPAECKLLDLTWNCSRTIMGKKANLSGGQSARIVIRKQ